LHAGRSFEGAQLTQLSRREFVQRRSFQLTDVTHRVLLRNKRVGIHGERVRFSPGSARVSRVGDRVLAIADFRKDRFGGTPKPARETRALPGSPRSPEFFARKVRPQKKL
jgi:hypothetical protein